MSTESFSEFELLIIKSENELGTSVLLVLAWIAASDGKVDKAEAKRLSEISAKSKHGHAVLPLLQMAKNRDTAAIQLACEIVAKHFRGERADLFLEMAIGMAIADGYLLPTENHILRFLADLLGINKINLNKLFIEVTGRNIPNPSDPSAAQYWRNRENTRRETGGDSNNSKNDTRPPPRTGRATQAYAILGLEENASKAEIRKAYRRLAQVHHPDRFSSLGEESIAAATATFQRINGAYEYLVSHA